jgi:Uma2 family endonuclease
MLKYVEPLDWLPTAEDLPDSDDTPVDNELQELAPTLLKAVLAYLWKDRSNWFFGIDMGIYYNPDEPAIVPDGFLSVGGYCPRSYIWHCCLRLFPRQGLP